MDNANELDRQDEMMKLERKWKREGEEDEEEEEEKREEQERKL